VRLTAHEIATATGGRWLHGVPADIEYVQTDSRAFEAGQLFLALRGEHFDGHQFAHTLVHQARAMVGDRQGVALWQSQAWHSLGIPLLEVEDTQVALGHIAHAWRQHVRQATWIGITGSYGKTTVRSMLMHLFQGLGLKVHATHANLNNLIGVPKTMLDASEKAELVLIECGISEQGEMQKLAKIVAPDVVVVTGISAAHAEGLGGMQGVVREKAQLLNTLALNGWYALGEGAEQAFQTYARTVVQEKMQHDVAWRMQGCELTLTYQHISCVIELALPAQHWGENMALVLSIALKYGAQHGIDFNFSDLVFRLASWQAVDGRMKKLRGVAGCTVLDDCYNANPVSMQMAIRTLQAMPARRTAILGDMKELGDDAAALHARLNVSGIEQVILVGEWMKQLHLKQMSSLWFETTDALLVWLSEHIDQFQARDTVLVKASNSMRLNQVVKLLSQQESMDVI